jgi:hypothetical protein
MTTEGLSGGGTQQFIQPDDGVETEADVEQKVIAPAANRRQLPGDTVAVDQGQGLPSCNLLDKIAGKAGGYYPDYSIWEKALPILIVEGQSPRR